MTPRKQVSDLMAIPTEDMEFAAKTLMAASSQLHVIYMEGKHQGRLNTGTVDHVRNCIDRVIEVLGLDTLEEESQKLPF